MNEDHNEDEGVILALLQRFETQRLPRALEIKKRVDAGEVLNQLDIEFLEVVFADNNKVQPLVDRHPEYGDLVAKIASLYKEITTKALENQEKNTPGSI